MFWWRKSRNTCRITGEKQCGLVEGQWASVFGRDLFIVLKNLMRPTSTQKMAPGCFEIVENEVTHGYQPCSLYD